MYISRVCDKVGRRTRARALSMSRSQAFEGREGVVHTACMYILIISQIEANVVLTHMAMHPVARSCDLQKNSSYTLYSTLLLCDINCLNAHTKSNVHVCVH